MTMIRTTANTVLRSRILSPLLLLGLWEVASRTGLIPEHTLAAPSTVLLTLLDKVGARVDKLGDSTGLLDPDPLST